MPSTAQSSRPSESTLPYAAWLRSRMDYFDVAEDLGRTAVVQPPPPSPRTNAPGTVAVQIPTNAAGANPATREVAVANPALYFAHALTLALIDRGIPVRGIPVVFQRSSLLAPLPRTAIVESPSPPLRAIATTMMKVSQNLYAETLLKAVGAGGDTAATANAGRAAAQKIFEGWGIQAGSYVQADGSGLSRYDLVTAEMIVTLLERMHKDPRHHDAFVATLPIAGKDGTISTRMRNTRAEGNAVAKTGSISNVRALSGYVRTQDGETLVFSILANSFTIPAATVNWIADVAVETLANYSRR